MSRTKKQTGEFLLDSKFEPSVEQARACTEIVERVKSGVKNQVLLGVTGSGKTFTMANIIKELSRPALVISHNKTLAAQLYQELREFFPKNAVSFFVSYYDYYQPEAYIPSTDTYIEKDADINETIDKLRLAATTNILTRKDTIVVASVSCIYNIGSPKEYGHFIFEFRRGMKVGREQIFDRVVDLQYERSDFGFKRGTFRVRGEIIDVFPSYSDNAVRIELGGEFVKAITTIDPLTGETIENNDLYVLYPSKHFVTNPESRTKAFEMIKEDLSKRSLELRRLGKNIESYRLQQKVNYDMDMIAELGYVKGIENYSRYFDGRQPGEAPFSLLDYFKERYGDNWNVFIDESHITFPQIRGMFNGDLARKNVLIDYGFRLPSALDNRPLRFEEFLRKVPNFIAMSATPGNWETSVSEKKPTEILVRPTGIPDPLVEIRKIEGQVADVASEIRKNTKKGQRTLVTTLTKKTAEDLAEFLSGTGIKAHYLHSDVATLDRSETLDDLRSGRYDAIIGINLLREGLDLPEVSLVAILDADKEGFLRSEVTLIQTMGRAARHLEGRVILYADKMTDSIKNALSEVERRRNYQIEYNNKYSIVPKSITKPRRQKMSLDEGEDTLEDIVESDKPFEKLKRIEFESLTPSEKVRLIKNLKKEMRVAASELDFEFAAIIRDRIKELTYGSN